MTTARQERKLAHNGAFFAAFSGMLVVVTIWAAGFVSIPVRAASTEWVVTNRYTGLAIDGFDPVAYFVEAAPLSGRPEHELRYAGVVWRFRNEGNAAAFAANPDIYMPRYGGYDPTAIVRSVAVPGNPLLWVRWEDRLYLFHTEDARARFLADPEQAVEQADIAWPGVLDGLMP
jgi:hypothetical protein